MSNKFNDPWSSRERIELLVNILQGQPQDLVSYLTHVIHENRITPRWPETALPNGRSLSSCQLEFDRLLHHQRPALQFPSVAPNVSASFPPTQQRFYHEQQPWQAPQPPPRAIQPRPSRSTDSPNPASTNGDPISSTRTVGPDQSGERRKKRGRPTKEEAEERDRVLAAEGKVYEPKKRPTKKLRTSTGAPGLLPETEGTTSSTIQTPLPQSTETKEETSSSGKRRSKRQGSLVGAEPSSPTMRMASDKAAESPSDRLLARFSDRGPERSFSGDASRQQ